jgi:hypothetical protein
VLASGFEVEAGSFPEFVQAARPSISADRTRAVLVLMVLVFKLIFDHPFFEFCMFICDPYAP